MGVQKTEPTKRRRIAPGCQSWDYLSRAQRYFISGHNIEGLQVKSASNTDDRGFSCFVAMDVVIR